MKKEYGHICIEELTKTKSGGGEYFSDIEKNAAEKLINKIKQTAKDFILANDCQVELVDYQSETGFGFYIINNQCMGLIGVSYERLYQREENESEFYQAFENILANFFQIKNPSSLLRKVSDEDSEDFFRMTIAGKLG